MSSTWQPFRQFQFAIYLGEKGQCRLADILGQSLLGSQRNELMIVWLKELVEDLCLFKLWNY